MVNNLKDGQPVGELGRRVALVRRARLRLVGHSEHALDHSQCPEEASRNAGLTQLGRLGRRRPCAAIRIPGVTPSGRATPRVRPLPRGLRGSDGGEAGAEVEVSMRD